MNAAARRGAAGLRERNPNSQPQPARREGMAQTEESESAMVAERVAQMISEVEQAQQRPQAADTKAALAVEIKEEKVEENETEKGAEEVTMAEAEDAAPAKQPEAEEDRKTKTPPACTEPKPKEVKKVAEKKEEQGKDKMWSEMTEPEQSAVVALGMSQATWDEPDDLPLGEGFYDKHDWGTLTESQREAAAVLGITAHDFESESEEEEETAVVPTVVASGGQPGSGWTPEEDSHLISLIAKHGEVDWPIRAKELGTGRSPKACQTRYRNHLKHRREGGRGPGHPERLTRPKTRASLAEVDYGFRAGEEAEQVTVAQITLWYYSVWKGGGAYKAWHERWADRNRDECEVCNKGGKLLCCGRCPASYHPRCCTPKYESWDAAMAELDGEAWTCPVCAGTALAPARAPAAPATAAPMDVAQPQQARDASQVLVA